MRLSDAQLRALNVMVEHDTTIMTVRSVVRTRAWFRGKSRGQDIRMNTIQALLKRELIRNIGNPAYYWRGGEYEITEAGRNELKGGK